MTELLTLGGISSFVVTALKMLIPPLGRWFDGLADDEKQAAMLWIAVAIVAVKTWLELSGSGGLPAEPADAARIIAATVQGVIATLIGQAGAYKATNAIALGRQLRNEKNDPTALGKV